MVKLYVLCVLRVLPFHAAGGAEGFAPACITTRVSGALAPVHQATGVFKSFIISWGHHGIWGLHWLKHRYVVREWRRNRRTVTSEAGMCGTHTSLVGAQSSVAPLETV